LIGFQYAIYYGSEKENIVVDALSSWTGAEILALAIILTQSNILDLIRLSYAMDPYLTQVVQ